MSMLLLTMGPNLSITMDTPALRVGEPGSITLRANGAVGQVKWVLMSSSLPAEWGGIVANGNEATISTGEALEWGTYSFTVRAFDTMRVPVERTFEVLVVTDVITIAPASASYTWLSGVPISEDYAVSGGNGEFDRAFVSSGSLPDGVSPSIVGDVLTISGTPTTVTAGATASVMVTDTLGSAGVTQVNYEVIPAWTYTGSMSTPRAGHTLTVLPDGRVLAIGGKSSQSGRAIASCEIYDPATGTWSSSAPMGPVQSADGREDHAAILMDDGRVLVAGGVVWISQSNTYRFYDPSTDTWSALGALPASHGRWPHIGRAADGRIIIAGGNSGGGAGCSIYDPSTDTWSAGASVIPNTGGGEGGGALHPVPGGLLLVQQVNSNNRFVKRYNPATDTWSDAPSNWGNNGRSAAGQAQLPNGHVVVAGHRNSGVFDDRDKAQSASVYDTNGELVAARISTFVRRIMPTCLPYQDGVMIIGGGDSYLEQTSTTSCVFFDGVTMHTYPSLNHARGQAAGVVLNNGKILITGGNVGLYGAGDGFTATCEVFG